MEGVFCCKLTFPHPHSGWFYVSHALRTQLTKVNKKRQKIRYDNVYEFVEFVLKLIEKQF